jgi:hypothetical protein
MKIKSFLTLSTTAVFLIVGVCQEVSPQSARASVSAVSGKNAQAAPGTGEGGASLESVAGKAGETGRRVAMSLIALAFAVAGVALAFRRDFKEAVSVFAVGFVAVLLVTPAGINLLHDTVNSLFASQ